MKNSIVKRHIPKVIADKLSKALSQARYLFGDDFYSQLVEWRGQRQIMFREVVGKGLTVGIFANRTTKEKDVAPLTFKRNFTYIENGALEALDEAFKILHEYHEDPSIYASVDVMVSALTNINITEIDKIYGIDVVEKIKAKGRGENSAKAGKAGGESRLETQNLNEIEEKYKALSEKNGGNFPNGRLTEFYKKMAEDFQGVELGSIKNRIEALRRNLGHTRKKQS